MEPRIEPRRSDAPTAGVLLSPATALFGVVVRPIQAFFRLEAASGVLLLACAVAALAWVNLGGARSYGALFGYAIDLSLQGRAVRFTVHQLVNDGLMTVFFFLVGMEIKRELAVGELSTPARAALPAIAALGGMVVPAGIYAAFNRGGAGQAGWGIPMATDIAFCIACLTLLRRRVPHGLVVFLTALAIFDDIGGILVIAVFYGSGVHAAWLGVAALMALVLVALSRRRIGRWAPYVGAGALLWYALHHGGIHPTIAGVVTGLAVPAASARRPRDVLEDLSHHSETLLRRAADDEFDGAALYGIHAALRQVEAPLDRFVHALHPWVAFGVMPLFALANSGVDLASVGPAEAVGPVAVGTALGLFAGKQAGIFTFAWAATRLGVAPMPGGGSLPKLLGVSIVAGVGFTVALFIAGLAFPTHPALLDQAKIGIIAGSLVSGVVGALVLLATPPIDGR